MRTRAAVLCRPKCPPRGAFRGTPRLLLPPPAVAAAHLQMGPKKGLRGASRCQAATKSESGADK